MKKIAVIIALCSVAACTAPPSSPEESAARKAAASELVAKRCAAYAGGYDSVTQLRKDANKSMATARALGASDELIKKAKVDTNNAFGMAEAFTSRQEACNQMIGELAWAQG